MLIQRSLLFVAAALLGTLFLGLPACGPAAPQDTESTFTGGTTFPQADTTDEPADEATESPTATPKPTVCITVQPGNHEVCESFPTSPPHRPKLTAEAANVVHSYEDEVRKAGERGGESTQRQVADPIVEIAVYPVSDDDEVIAAIAEVLDDANVWYRQGPARRGDSRYFSGEFPASLIIELEEMPEVKLMRAAQKAEPAD